MAYIQSVFYTVIIFFCLSVSWVGCTPKAKRADYIEDTDSALTRQARLVFAGDLMQHLPQIGAARTESGQYDYSESFCYVKNIFEEADIAILNFETTLTPYAR